MSKFSVYDINEITTSEIGNEFQVYAHCELEDLSNNEGGEAFGLRIIQCPELEVEYEIQKGELLMKAYNKNKAIEILKDFIEAIDAESWDDLHNEVVKTFYNWI